MSKSEDDLTNLFRSGSAKRAFIVTFQPIMAPAGFSLRVPAKEVEWDGHKAQPLRTLTVMYLTRVPRTLETQRGVSEEQFKSFRQSGPPSRLSVETEKSVKEAAALLEVMAANIARDDSIPREWRDLPKIGPLEKAGRA
jgi:hypothetical protein